MLPTFLMFLFLVVFFGVGLWLIYRKLVEESNQRGPVRSIWQHLAVDLVAALKHPHPWAREADRLMDLFLKELMEGVLMVDEDYERLVLLVAGRINSTEPELREGEREDAAILLLAMPRARRDAKIRVELTGVRLVGSKAPSDQSVTDERARENAN